MVVTSSEAMSYGTVYDRNKSLCKNTAFDFDDDDDIINNSIQSPRQY